MLHDQDNTLFTLAADFINYTNRSVFLTGRAGTGKTTFLKYIKENTTKQTAVVAPTGVAAINAGGVTIHSFFQLPFTPYVPESRGFEQSNGSVDRHHLLGRIKMTRDRREVLQQLELLIIDEISMVRCDVLDAIDTVLRHFRARYHEPFGGVQLLFIGDMFQLPPVVPDEEWGILSGHYQSPFFFDSKVIQLETPVHIELNKIYRQNEQQFIQLLNKVRNNAMDEDGYNLLESRYNPAFQPGKDEGYITLTTHNYKADTINNEEVAKLEGVARNYKATVTGEFYEKSYPAEEMLQLRVGAQVMMIKNDTEKRFFNGKIGTVTRLENETVHVQCKNETTEIEVKKEKWENIRYTINQTNQQVDEDMVGSFEQFPLRLAWAITIHKSQGLTFEKAVIDAGAAFAPGQVYVALSRCTTLQGIVLKSRLSNNGFRNDQRIMRFAESKHAETHLTGSLTESKIKHQSKLLTDLFDLDALLKPVSALYNYTEQNKDGFNEEALPWIKQVEQMVEKLRNVMQKFKPQLQQLLQDNIMPELNELLQKRITAAAAYFSEHLQNLLSFLFSSAAITDSKQKAMLYNDALKELNTTVAQKQYLIKGCMEGYNANNFYTYRKKFVVPALRVNSYATANKNFKTDSAHPELFKQLRTLRDKICAQKDLPVYLVASGATLDELTKYLPQTVEELAKVSGFGKAKTESYGQQFVDIIAAYSAQHNLVSLIHEKDQKRERKEKSNAPKIDTKLETYKLYLAGTSIAEIAAERNLAVGTIEGHLAYYVQNGEIKIEDILSKEKILLIEPLAKTMDGNALTPLKEMLGNSVSFGEIKLVIASLEHLKISETAGENIEK